MEFGTLKKLKIIILADNTAVRPGKFLAEYGFSAYIEAESTSELGILFDTGCGLVFEENMLQAGVDWSDIDYIVLSHRHFDHTGGLLKAVENCTAPIVAHPDIFMPNLLRIRGQTVNAGIPFTKAQLEAKGARFIFIRDMFKLMDGIAVSGEIPRVSDEKVMESYTFRDGKMAEDNLLDDMAIFTKTKHGGVVITGCAHSGIINTILRGQEIVGEVHAALGGFHLMFSPPDVAEKVMGRVMELSKVVGPTHCSGVVAQSFAIKKGPERYIQLGSGIKLKF